MNKDFWLQFFLDAKIERSFASQYADIFVTHQMRPWNLHLLNQAYLDAMGINLCGHVMSILDHVEKKLFIPMAESIKQLRRYDNQGSNRTSVRPTILPGPRSRSNTESSLDRTLFSKTPLVDGSSFHIQQDPPTHTYHQSRPSTSSSCLASDNEEEVEKCWRNKSFSLPPTRHQPSSNNCGEKQTKPRQQGGDANNDPNWKQSQAKEKIQLLKNVKVPFFRNDRSNDPYLAYFRHRAVSMEMELQEENLAISRRKPIPSFTGKGCLKLGEMKSKLDHNYSRKDNEEKVLLLRVGFCPGGPVVRMIPPTDKAPAYRSMLEKGEFHFKSHLRRNRCLSLLNRQELEEINATFPQEMDQHKEDWVEAIY